MKYINAAAVLPASLVEELQNYVQSGYLYVPAREDQHRAWGERNGGREELRKRNKDILDAWQNGVSMETDCGKQSFFFCTKQYRSDW